jgi:hypothetical protein
MGPVAVARLKRVRLGESRHRVGACLKYSLSQVIFHKVLLLGPRCDYAARAELLAAPSRPTPPAPPDAALDLRHRHHRRGTRSLRMPPASQVPQPRLRPGRLAAGGCRPAVRGDSRSRPGRPGGGGRRRAAGGGGPRPRRQGSGCCRPPGSSHRDSIVPSRGLQARGACGHGTAHLDDRRRPTATKAWRR